MLTRLTWGYWVGVVQPVQLASWCRQLILPKEQGALSLRSSYTFDCDGAFVQRAFQATPSHELWEHDATNGCRNLETAPLRLAKPE